MESVTPVIIGLEPFEQKVGENSPYRVLHALRSPDGKFISRWHLSDEERAQVAAGGDIYLTLWTFNKYPYPPTLIQIFPPDVDGEAVKKAFMLDDELALRCLAEDMAKACQRFEEKRAEVGQKFAARVETKDQNG